MFRTFALALVASLTVASAAVPSMANANGSTAMPFRGTKPYVCNGYYQVDSNGNVVNCLPVKLN
jgi:hypothetical protein